MNKAQRQSKKIAVLIFACLLLAGACRSTDEPTDEPVATATVTATVTAAPVPTSTLTPTPMPTSTLTPTPVPAPTRDPSLPSLRELANQRGLRIGAAVSPDPLRNDPAYVQVLTREFNSLTVENALKFGPVHPQPDVYTFADADLTVEFAEENGMQVRGHVLIWHQQLAGWVEQGDWTREQLIEVMRDHIYTVVGRYKGRIQVWDVVNEAIADSGAAMRSTVWRKAIGDDYLDLAFQFAHEADPEAKLFYNDYNAEEMNRKADSVYELVKGMLERGVPVHGVGLQMHLALTRSPNWAQVAENIARLNALGLEVHITELDVRVLDPPDEAKLARQAEVYRNAMQTCLDAQACTAFITWGVTDRYSWVPYSFKGTGSALLFDEQYQPKPAYDAVYELLQSREVGSEPQVQLPTLPAEIADWPVQVFEIINALRAEQDLLPLEYNETLETVARLHGEDCRQRGSCDHTGSDGSTVKERVGRSGYQAQGAAEVMVYEYTPQGAVDWWMDEVPPDDPHRRTLLGEFLTEIGIAVVPTDQGYYYFIADLARPQSP